MANLVAAIRRALDEQDARLKGCDLSAVMAVLRPLFPKHSEDELAWNIVQVAIQDGCPHLIWEPPDQILPPEDNQ